jgi:beta-glucanase (GH16 family)
VTPHPSRGGSKRQGTGNTGLHRCGRTPVKAPWLILTAGILAVAISGSAMAASTSSNDTLDHRSAGVGMPISSSRTASITDAHRPAHTPTVVDPLQPVDLSTWNTFLTDAATNGSSWNPDSAGGSGLNAGGYDAESFLPSHVWMAGAGVTVIATPSTARPGYQFASGVLTSYGHAQFDGGTIQVEARMPDMTTGAWPSLWLLPAAGDTQNDEIDIFEGGLTFYDNANHNFSGFIHTDGHQTGSTVDVDTDLARGVHTYTISWVPGTSVTWYLDGRRVSQVTSAQTRIPSGPMQLVIDTAVATQQASSWHTVTTGAGTYAMQVLGVQYSTNPGLLAQAP